MIEMQSPTNFTGGLRHLSDTNLIPPTSQGSKMPLNVITEVVLSTERYRSTHAPVIEDTREETTIDREESDIMMAEPPPLNQYKNIMIQ